MTNEPLDEVVEPNEPLNDVVERLLVDRRFLRRFRRNPARTLRPYGLSEREVEAVKVGRPEELVRLGLDPRYIAPPPRANEAAMQGWLLNNARRLVPAALLAAATLLFATAPTAPAGRRRVNSKVKIKKTEDTGDGLKVKGVVRSKKDACERKRVVGVEAVVRRAQAPPQTFFVGGDKTNRKGKWKTDEHFNPSPNARVSVQARVFPKEKGNKLCRADTSKFEDV